MFHFLKEPIVGQYEQEAIGEGLEYTDELILEEGQIYRGYLKDGKRHGPGI